MESPVNGIWTCATLPGTVIRFPKSVNQFTHPPTVAHGSYCSISSPTFGILDFQIRASSVGVKWYLVVDFVLFPLFLKSWGFWFCVSPFVKCLFIFYAHFIIYWDVDFYLSVFRSYFWIQMLVLIMHVCCKYLLLILIFSISFDIVCYFFNCF